MIGEEKRLKVSKNEAENYTGFTTDIGNVDGPGEGWGKGDAEVTEGKHV